jgi:hypothetical protein
VGFLTDERRKKKMSTTNVGTKAMHISLELEKNGSKINEWLFIKNISFDFELQSRL